MAPPQENVGALQHVPREPVLGVREGRGANRRAVAELERMAAATASWIPSG